MISLGNSLLLVYQQTVPDFFSKIFTDISQASAALTVVFALVALIVAIVIALRSDIGLAVKVLGTLLVLAICFASNNGFVYAIGIFIVATLVTELEFLEKLAAIVWNRKEYWDYLKVKATPTEIEAKLKEEIAMEPEEIEGEASPLSIPQERAQKIVKDAYDFYQKALKALKKPGGPLKFIKLEEETRLRGEGHDFILDGIAHSDKAIYIIEIKSTRPRDLTLPVYQLDRYIQAYRRYAEERRVSSKPIRGILVLPSGSVERDWTKDVPILKFNAYDETFSNIDKVKNHFPDWDWN